MSLKRFFRSIITILVLGIIIVSVFYYRIQTEKKAQKAETGQVPVSDQAKKESKGSVTIDAEAAFIGELIIRVSAQGIVEADKNVVITPKVGGEIVQLPVKEGLWVKKGDLLFKIDDTEYRLSYEDAKSSLLKKQLEYALQVKSDTDLNKTNNNNNSNTNIVDNFIKTARDNFKDADNKLKNGRINTEEYKTLKRNMDIAEALSGGKRDEIVANNVGLTGAETSFKRAEMNLQNCCLFAPFGGEIAALDVQKWDRVSAGKECMRLIDRSLVKIRTNVLESEVGYLEIGRKAAIKLSSFPDRIFHGSVETISPVVDEKTKTCEVFVSVDNPEGDLKPGMFAFVNIDAQIFKDKLLVNKNAILVRDRRELIFIIRDGKAKWSYVEKGLENEDYVEILKSAFGGLEPGEMVAVSGHYTLSHDANVKTGKGK